MRTAGFTLPKRSVVYTLSSIGGDGSGSIHEGLVHVWMDSKSAQNWSYLQSYLPSPSAPRISLVALACASCCGSGGKPSSPGLGEVFSGGRPSSPGLGETFADEVGKLGVPGRLPN